MFSFNLLVKTICLIIMTPFVIVHIKKKYSLFRHILFTLFFIYLCMIVKVVFFPIPVDVDIFKQFLDTSSLRYNLVPFKFLFDYFNLPNSTNMRAIWEACKNIILFMPMGFLLPLIMRLHYKIGQVLLIGIIASISIELLQLALDCLLILSYRVIDIDDLIMNSLGTLIGLMLFIIFNRIVIAKFHFTIEKLV